MTDQSTPTKSRRFKRMLVLTAVLIPVLVLGWLFVSLQASISPKPATTAAMERLKIHAQEQFPDADFEYEHWYHKDNAIHVDGRIPVDFPLTDADTERIGEFVAEHYTASLDGRWRLSIILRLVDGDQTLRVEGPLVSAEDVRLGSDLSQLGFESVLIDMFSVVLAGRGCGVDDDPCRTTAAGDVLTAFDFYTAHREHHPDFAPSIRVDVAYDGTGTEGRQDADTTFVLSAPLGDDRERGPIPAGWREPAEAALAAWTVAPLEFETRDGGEAWAYLNWLQIPAGSPTVEANVQAWQHNGFEPEGWDAPREQFEQRIRNAAPDVEFEFG